jgi:hypothetical protein
MADQDGKRRGSGCAVLFLLWLILGDAFGVLVQLAQPYSPIVLTIGPVGFVCGAALGIYLSVKIKQQRWYSSCRWAIYGLLGMCLLSFAAFAVVSGWLQTAR